VAFLVSCILLMGMSWIVAFYPSLALKPEAQYGVPVKNYMIRVRSLRFAQWRWLSVMTLLRMGKNGRRRLASVASLIVINMIFVNCFAHGARHNAIMVAVFAMLHLKWRPTSPFSWWRSCWRCWRGLSSPGCNPYETLLSDIFTTAADKPTRSGYGLNSGRIVRFFADAPIVVTHRFDAGLSSGSQPVPSATRRWLAAKSSETHTIRR